jgi:hypothetical protein
VTTICTGIAVAQSPVAYVYVGENATQTPFSAISAYAASSDGRLSQIKGSPFTQTTTTGFLLGTNGTHAIVVGPNPNDLGGVLYYLYSYQVGSDGAIGPEVSMINTAAYDGSGCSGREEPAADFAVLDHTGQYIYVPYCTTAIQTYKIAHNGGLTFQNATLYSDPDFFQGGPPKIAGNDAYAYNMRLENLPIYGSSVGLSVFTRESDGSLEYLSDAAVTGPSLPKNYYSLFAGFPGNYYYPEDLAIAPMTSDRTNHFAVDLGIEKFIPPDTSANVGCALASFTMGSHGELTSTNTYENMPAVCAQAMLLSPSGTVLAVLPNGGQSLKFFHFNGSEPISPLSEVTGTSGWFTTMAWDSSNHLYALNGLSGRLHVYNVTSTAVVEAPGSPYDLPFCGLQQPGDTPACLQNLVVRSVP